MGLDKNKFSSLVNELSHVNSIIRPFPWGMLGILCLSYLEKPPLTRGLVQIDKQCWCGPEEIRTLDLRCAKATLYQLSYRPGFITLAVRFELALPKTNS